jgi:DNA-directed RNA polymerase specialized sigma24 family protein
MAGGYVISVDPSEIASRFSSKSPGEEPMFDEDGPVASASADTDSPLASLNYETQIKPLLDRIPEREADLIHLYYIERKRQADIAEIFGVTQAAISYRLDRGLQRIRFLLSIPQIDEDDMRRDLPKVPFKEIDVNILVGMWETTCQSEVAKRLDLTQGRVRHRFFGAVKVLEKRSAEDETFVPYHKVFSAIAGKKFNILREVRLPQWANRGGDGCF